MKPQSDSALVAEVDEMPIAIRWSHGRWILKFKVKGGRERTIPLPGEVRKAIEEY